MHSLESTYAKRLKTVFLFGSYARHEAHAASDIDLLVVLTGKVHRYEENWRLSDTVLDILRKFGKIVSFVVISEDEFDQADWPLLMSIRDEGIKL